jgi:hypothetical protein
MKRIHITNIDRYTSYNSSGSWFKYYTLHILTRDYPNYKLLIYYPDETNTHNYNSTL